MAGLAAVYFGAGKLGLSLAFVNASASAVWPPTGIALAAAVLLGYRVWPGILLGAFLVNLTTTGGVGTSIAIALGNTLEALAGAWLLHRFADGRQAFKRPRGILRFVLFVAMPSAAISATWGVTALSLGGLARWPDFSAVWATWWIGDVVSSLIIAPTLLVWLGTPTPSILRQRKFEAIALCSLLSGAGLVVFGGWLPSGIENYPLEYLLIPLTLWAVFRFGPRGGTAAILVLAIVAVTGTLHGFGPFALQEPNNALLLLQSFLSTISVTALVLGAVVSEREESERCLHLQHTVSLALANASEVRDASEPTLKALSEQFGWDLAALWTIDRTGSALQSVSVCHSSSSAATAFAGAILSQGDVAKPESSPAPWNSQSALPCPYRFMSRETSIGDAAREHGLDGGFLFPIEFGGKSYGVFGFFDPIQQEVDADAMALLAAVGLGLAQLIKRTQAEAELRESEERYRALAETSPAGIWQTTIEGHTLFMNPAMCRLLEIDGQGEMNGKTYRDFYTPDSIERVRQEHAKRLRGAASNYEVEIVGRRKTRRHLLICGAPLCGRDGKVHSFIATLTDITPQKHALDALRASERRFQTLADNSPDIIARFDRDHRYLYINPAVQTLFGHSIKTFLGKTNHEAGMPDDFCALWDAGIAQAFGSAEEQAHEFSLCAAGETRHYHSRLVPEAGKDDRVETVLAVTRDVTDLKKAEAEIMRLNQDLERRVRERTSALQETNDQLEAFCYSVSHDLRAPLRAMQGFTEALIEDCGPDLNAAGHDYARRIATAARRMDKLIQDLLEYSRLGRVSLAFRIVRPELVLVGVLRQMAEQIRERQAEVIVQQPLPDLIANETVLEQVLVNLLSNALKFVSPGVPPRIVIAATEDSTTVRLSVTDNGIGIDPMHYERVFRVFERLHGMENYPGTGIGLAIVRKGVERMGGRVGLQSSPGMGSCFWIELPKKDSNVPRSA